jgi:hypothetical protein
MSCSSPAGRPPITSSHSKKRKLIVTAPKTLGEYRDFVALIADEDSPAVKFFDDKIREQGNATSG